jgi:hypothetical protein
MRTWVDVLTYFMFGAMFIASAVIACTPAEKAAAKSVLDISGAICTELAVQPEPAWVTFACAVVSVGDAAGPTFLAKVKKEDAPTFAARHCPSGKGP